MKKLLLLWCLALVMTGLAVLPTQGAPKYKITVLPFDDGSIHDRWWDEEWKLGKGVSDELITALLDTNRFRVIERGQLDKVLEEQNFGAYDRVDPELAAKIGQILGVQYLVIGKVTEFTFKSVAGSISKNAIGLGIKTTTARVTIDARLVDTTTAEIVAGVKGAGVKKQTNLGLVYDWSAIGFGSDEFYKTNIGVALRDAITQVADGLSQKVYENAGPEGQLTGLIAYISGVKIYINLGSSDGIRPGMIFTVYRVLDVVKDPSTGEVIDEVSEPIAEISVTEVKEKASTCIVTTKLTEKYTIAIQDQVQLKP